MSCLQGQRDRGGVGEVGVSDRGMSWQDSGI